MTANVRMALACAGLAALLTAAPLAAPLLATPSHAQTTDAPSSAAPPTPASPTGNNGHVSGAHGGEQATPKSRGSHDGGSQPAAPEGPSGATGPAPKDQTVTLPDPGQAQDKDKGQEKGQEKGQAAPAAAKTDVKPTVILVHSELLDGSSWRGVIPLLERAGVPVQAVQLPLNSMWADVAVIQRALAIVKGPVILVGHSWGGVIITEAGVDRKVAALVYVAAMAPDVGQSFIERLRNAPRGPGLARLLTDSSGFVRLADDAFATDFGQDLTPAQNRLLAATQAPVFGKVFEERVNNAAWKNLPVWYVVAANDRLLDPEAQKAEAARIKARTSSAPAGHAVVLSQPQIVAQAILDAVAAVKAGAAAGHDGTAQQLQPLTPPAPANPPAK